jgi:hypothetical protein
VSTLHWLEAFTLGHCKANSHTSGLEKKSLISCAVPLLFFFFGDCTSLARCCCTLSVSLRLVRNFTPEKGEIQQSASLYRSGSLASMENARSGVGLQGETLPLDIQSLEVIIEREIGLLAALSLRSHVGLLQRVLWTLNSYLSGLVLCLGLFSYISATFSTTAASWIGGKAVCCGFS